ncbi:MAG TPA: NDP-sugar synthase [Sporichthyaceae bacterium]|nr:NDP-sugar synthase [Sporichthyaceae bacterium]
MGQPASANGGAAAEAILLVGGQGSRMRPLTVNIPKPMLPCAGVPLLTHQLLRLRDAGVRHVVLATSYRPEVFTDHFGDGSGLGLRLDYMTETEPLGTGGGIRNAAALLEPDPDAPVLIFNGDVMSGHDLTAQLAVHAAARAEVTLHLVRVSDPRAFGCVPTAADGRVAAFLEKSPEPVSDQINAGCYIFRRGTIDKIPAGRVVSVERDTFPGLLAAGAVVVGHVDCAYWLDLGTPAAYVQGSADLVRGVLASAAVADPGPALLAPDSAVAADAVVDAGSAVGPGATIGAGAQVSGSVLLDGARIGAGAVVRDSVVGVGARIGERTRLTGAVVGDHACVGADNELIAGARVWPDVVIADHAIRFSAGA